MTIELARPVASLPPMPSDSAPSLLARRLERLRGSAQLSAGAIGATPLPHAPGLHAGAQARVAALVAAFGGRVIETSDGPLVSVESEVELSLELDALARLPFALDVRRPLVCIDLETTGLGTAAGTVPFLVGIGTWHEGRLAIRQLMLPDHADEAALLSALRASIAPDAWLVTYNGRSFDWPLLVSRFRLHRREPPAHAGHLDLLPVARGLWKHRLGNARLATVEQIAGVRRSDDLPGSLVPERYFSYLRDRRPEPLRAVLVHNRQDVISLGLLLGVMADQLGRRDHWPALHPGDLAGLARAYRRQQRSEEALACFDAALRRDRPRPVPAEALPVLRRMAADRARLLARLGRREEAGAAWLRLASRGGTGAAMAWIHVARHREHFERDAASALEAAEQAAGIAERARAWGRPLLAVERDLLGRMPRLRWKVISGRVSPVAPRRVGPRRVARPGRPAA